MGVASFQQLSDEFCDAAGVERQHLVQDGAGAMTFSTDILDVAVNVTHMQATHPDHAFLLVDFGPAPEQDEALALRTLLLINFTFLGHETATAFSIHPVYGNVTLQATYPLHKCSGAHLLKSIRILADSALQWRQTHFLPEGTESFDKQAAEIDLGLRA
ncbi:CesT family type III secretion system chaperone [Caenimonas koreensis]|uniref:Tir chaperone protein (CesT) family protein n=1 Tax=Caenimonas koreensis DSM 17982 TaxID=1121255 RepID=A0A844B2D1_9BURK|nr:CesT family type III secretion system chaperone [Caenimonas koreensis]MRD47363.1 hypothetical protein [Caenimonas koreensis DSM 17982]